VSIPQEFRNAFAILTKSFTASSVWLLVSFIAISLAGDAEKAAAGAVDTSQDRAALEKLVKRFEAAWNDADVDSMALLFSADGALVMPNGSIVRTRAQIKQLISKERENQLREATIGQ
jgi:hypothetical protein